jgi:pimeloyl-ACP methyl ester carboxylesterase
MKRIDADFSSRGARCAAWLYLPDPAGRPPVVVMAHGLAAERSFRLPAFAERFAGRGLAVLLFDYRNFGDSEGEPRNWISPARHLEDWAAAIRHARGLREVDAGRIALWGSSFSGGHVLVAAARDQNIAAVVSQVPFVDGIAVARGFDWKFTVTGLGHGLSDLGRILTWREPHYVPVVADPGTFALMNTPESKPGYLALVPEGSSWKNQAPARIILTLPLYRPLRAAPRLHCPVLLIGAEKDSLIPIRAVEKLAGRIKQVRLEKVAAGHFDVYAGDMFEKVVKLEADFLVETLRPGR